MATEDDIAESVNAQRAVGKHEAATATLREWVADYGDNSGGLWLIAQALENRSNPDDAKVCYNAAWEAATPEFRRQFMQAQQLLKIGNLSAAVETVVALIDYRRVASIHPAALDLARSMIQERVGETAGLPNLYNIAVAAVAHEQKFTEAQFKSFTPKISAKPDPAKLCPPELRALDDETGKGAQRPGFAVRGPMYKPAPRTGNAAKDLAAGEEDDEHEGHAKRTAKHVTKKKDRPLRGGGTNSGQIKIE
jgi:hypothetical protein